MHDLAKLFEEIQRRLIENRMNSVEPERIDVIVGDPFQGIKNEKATDLIALRVIEIQARTPRRFVTIREIGPELRQVISFRTDVVVDDVQNHPQPALMTSVDQFL